MSEGGLRPLAKTSIYGGLRRIGRAALFAPPVVSLLARVPRCAAVILRYHSVNDDPKWACEYMQDSLVVHPDVFERQVRFLCGRFRIVSVGEIADALSGGRPLEGRAVAITFDDGYEDNYRMAYPILATHGVTGTFYVTSSSVADARILWTVRLRHAIKNTEETRLCVNGAADIEFDLGSDECRERAIRRITHEIKSHPREAADAILTRVLEMCGPDPTIGERRVMMTWGEMREMRDGGMTIGAHTVGHYNMTRLSPEDVRVELSASKSELEQNLGSRIDHFAYPNGRTGMHMNPDVAQAVADAGYRSAVTSLAGPVLPGYSAYCIPRMGVGLRHANMDRLAGDVQYTRLSHCKDSVVDDVPRCIEAKACACGEQSDRPPGARLRDAES